MPLPGCGANIAEDGAVDQQSLVGRMATAYAGSNSGGGCGINSAARRIARSVRDIVGFDDRGGSPLLLAATLVRRGRIVACSWRMYAAQEKKQAARCLVKKRQSQCWRHRTPAAHTSRSAASATAAHRLVCASTGGVASAVPCNARTRTA